MKKIDLEGFNLNEMLAKLLVISRRFENEKDTLLEDRTKFDTFVTNQVEQSFIYNSNNQVLAIARHLSLFLLGNPNNQFSKLCVL